MKYNMKFGAILIDPPWAYKDRNKPDVIGQRAAEQHYRTMPLHEIAGLPVPDLAERNCALFMWAVDSHLDVAIDLLKVWGFRYKTIAFVWIKLKDDQLTLYDPPPARIGMGHWSRKQSEICLLATKGRPKRLSKGVRQVIQVPRRQHSRKPDETYRRIEALVPGPYLEMFARQRQPGWSSWGSEVDKFSATKILEPTTNQEKLS